MKLETRCALYGIVAAVLMLQGCTAFLAGTAAGGAAGYMLHDEGYEVQSPVVHQSRDKHTE